MNSNMRDRQKLGNPFVVPTPNPAVQLMYPTAYPMTPGGLIRHPVMVPPPAYPQHIFQPGVPVTAQQQHFGRPTHIPGATVASHQQHFAVPSHIPGHNPWQPTDNQKDVSDSYPATGVNYH